MLIIGTDANSTQMTFAVCSRIPPTYAILLLLSVAYKICISEDDLASV